MDISFLFAIFAVANSGAGLGAGIGIGMPLGIPIGSALGSKNARKRITHSISAAIKAGDISIADKNGRPMTAESLFTLLQERSNKM